MNKSLKQYEQPETKIQGTKGRRWKAFIKYELNFVLHVKPMLYNFFLIYFQFSLIGLPWIQPFSKEPLCQDTELSKVAHHCQKIAIEYLH